MDPSTALPLRPAKASRGNQTASDPTSNGDLRERLLKMIVENEKARRNEA